MTEIVSEADVEDSPTLKLLTSWLFRYLTDRQRENLIKISLGKDYTETYTRLGQREAMKSIFVKAGNEIISKLRTVEDNLKLFDSPPTIVAAPIATAPAQSTHALMVFLNDKEKQAVEELMIEQDLSPQQLFIQALRHYQLSHHRLKQGEIVTWSGDEQRARDFAGPTHQD